MNKELRKCLEYLDPAARENLAHIICGVRSFRKIFTLLTVVGKQSDIKLFVEEDVADDDLPFIKVPSKDSSLFQLGRRHSPCESLQLIKCFDAWSPASIRIFEDWQWTTLAPTFECGERKNIKHLELLENIPLPFTSHDDTDSSIVNGGQSTVFKVNIHPDHHGFQSSQVRLITHFYFPVLLIQNWSLPTGIPPCYFFCAVSLLCGDDYQLTF